MIAPTSAAPAPLERVFAALADPTRRAIVERLSQRSASVSQLARPLAMSLAAVGQHVQQLEASGLIATAKHGRVRTCRLRPEALQAVEAWVSERRATWERRFDRLADVLDESAPEGG